MSRWFRMYDDLLNDPKVQRLSPELFKLWVNCLCVASKHEGRFPSWQDMAFMMRMDVSKLAKSMQSLMDAGLIDRDSNGSFPHGWENRQFKSDVSNERVSRFRERKRNAQCNVTPPVTVTPPDTEQSTEQNRKREKRARAKLPIPEDYTPNETTRRVNEEHGFSESDLSRSMERMHSWALGDNVLKADWNATHQNWIRRDAEKRGANNVQAGKSVHAAVARLDDFAHGRTRNPFDHASGDAAGSTPPRLLSQG